MKSLFYVGFVSFVFCCDGNYFCRLLRHFLCLHLYCVNSDTLFRLHSQGARKHLFFQFLALKAPIATKVVCFSRLLNCLRSLYDKQYGPKNIKQSFAADDIFRCFFFLVLQGLDMVNVLKFQTHFTFLMVIRAGIHEMIARIANREGPD